MKNVANKTSVFLVVALIALATTVTTAQNTELPTLVAQLQKTPTDNALREKIIKLAAAMHPAPAVPDEAIRFEGRAQYAFKDAKGPGDLLVAAAEYEKAIAIAPWIGGYYSDICTIYERAGRPADAKRNCGFYLLTLTDAAEIAEAKRHIAGLEFAAEKAAIATDEQKKSASLTDFTGIWRQSFDTPGANGFPPGKYNSGFRIVDTRTIYHSYNIDDSSPRISQFTDLATEVKISGRDVSFHARTPGVNGTINYSLSLSDDGKHLNGFWWFTQDDTSRGLGTFAQLGRVSVSFTRD